MATAPKLPLSQRLDLRILIFLAVFLILLDWPVYSIISEAATGGIHDRGVYKEVDLKALGFFKFDPYAGSLRDIPARYRALDGQKVLLIGLVLPGDQAGENITSFTLQYSTISCCLGSGLPLVQEKIYATAAPGAKLRMTRASYYRVLGTLHVSIKRTPESGLVEQVYHLDADKIEPL